MNMITDRDIKKLKEVFDTKQESKKRHEETMKRFDGIDETLGDMTHALGAVFEWTDDIHKVIVGKFVKRSPTSA